ncbi:hypothetical protein KQH50_01610 [bacterium]|nr:hypothetical protein [bacterium]
MKKSIAALLLILLATLTACTRQVGWVGMNYGTTLQASYQFFDGPKTETIRLEGGETFIMDYDVNVDDGALTLQWIGPGRTLVWEETFTADAEDVYTFSPNADGRYTLRVLGEETEGGFDLQWEIAD